MPSGNHRHTALLLLALGLAALAYRDLITYEPERPIASEAEFFFEPSSTSPGLVLGAALFLAYRKREILRRAIASTRASMGPASALLLAGAVVFVWARYVRAPDLLAPSLALTVLGGAWFAGGAAASRALLLPSIVLLFAAPPPAVVHNQIIYALQIWTAELATWMLNAIGVDAIHMGDRILTAGRIFQVIESCSGMRSIETLTMTAVIYVDLFYRSRLHALLVVVSAPLIAFLLNGARVLSIALAPESQAVSDHTIQGIVALVVGVLLVALVELVVRRVLPERTPPGEPATGLATPVAWGRRALALVGVAGLLLAASVAMPSWSPLQPPEHQLHRIPPRLGDWQASGLRLPREFLGSVGFSEWVHRRYERGNESVDVFLGSDDRLSRSRSVISAKNALPESGWRVEEERTVTLGTDELTVQTAVLRSLREQALTLHWYEGTGGLASEALRCYLGLDQSPFRREGSALVVRLSTPVGSHLTSRADADARLREFATLLRPVLSELRSAQRDAAPARLAGPKSPRWRERS